MINQEFCTHLEQIIGEAFTNSKDKSINHFICDGVLLPTFEEYYSKKYVNDNRQIDLTAFIGLDGQNKVDLTLKFGKKSLSRYARGLEITECIPDPQHDDWYEFDLTNKKMTIQLL